MYSSFQSRSLDIVIPVYNGKNELKELFPYIRSWIDVNDNVHVFVVDDGSKDKLDDIFSDESLREKIHLISHQVNSGRGEACNTGLRAGHGEFVAFLDVDCIPDEGWISRFIVELSDGYDGVFGNIKASSKGFWSDYANTSYRSRIKKFRESKLVYSTPFCAFSRSALESVDGFFSGYKYYGFEDKDLINSLVEVGKAKFTFLEDVNATHKVIDSLTALGRKMNVAGKLSAPVYFNRFPDHYKDTIYWWFDSRVHGRLYNLLLSVITIPGRLICSSSSRLFECKYIPFSFKKFLVQYLMSVNFWLGSRQV